MTADGAGAPPRRHGAQLEAALLDAAWGVLLERGYDGFTYEAVAERASTSRPVLYRRWPDRQSLLLATLRAHWTPVPIPDTGSLRGDALRFLTDLGNAREQHVTLLTVQLGEYFAVSGTTPGDLRTELRTTETVRPCAVIVERAVARGELSPGERPARMVDLPFDLVRHEVLMTRAPIHPSALVEIVDTLWIPLLQRQP